MLPFRKAAAPAAKASTNSFLPIAGYRIDTDVTDSRGQSGIKIQPVLADGKDHPKAPNYWIRLENFDGTPDPQAMRAFARSLPVFAHALATLDADGVAAGVFSADGQYKLRETAAPAQAAKPTPAPKAPETVAAKLAAAKAKRAAPPSAAAQAAADGAVAVDLDASLENLPF